MRKQNQSVQQQAGRKCLDSGFVRVSPAPRGQSPTVGLSDLVLDSCWGSDQQVLEEAQVLLPWLSLLALWNTCASESRGLGTIATLCDSSRTWSEKKNIRMNKLTFCRWI